MFTSDSISLFPLLKNVFIYVSIYRSKDYTAPVNFVSAGLRKTAAEEKQQQKQEAGSDDDDANDGDGDDDAPSAPPPPRGGAPKKLQMVTNTFKPSNVTIYSAIMVCQNNLTFFYSLG